VPGTIAAVMLEAETPRLVVSFDSPDRDTVESVLELLKKLTAGGGSVHPTSYEGTTEVIRSPERLRTILRGLFATGSTSRLLGLEHGSRHELMLRPMTIRAGDELPLIFEASGRCPTPPFDIEMMGYLSNFLMRVDSTSQRDRRLRVAMPAELVRTRSRHYRRVAPPAGARVSFVHPLFPEVSIERPIRDLSLRGLSFLMAPKDAMFPGLDLPQVQIDWPGRLRVLFSGRIRHVTSDTATGSDFCGVDLVPIRHVTSDTATGSDFCGVDLVPQELEDEERWRDATARIFHPDTRIGVGWHRELWELYDASRYFGIAGRAEPDFRRVRRSFAKVNRAVAPAIACQVVWPSQRGVEASISMMKVYSGTWVGAQLARRPGLPPEGLTNRRVLRDTILHGFEHLQRDPGFTWLMSWVRNDSPFARRLFCELAERFAADGRRAAIVPFRAMEGRCDRAGLEPPAGLSVAPARADELDTLLKVIEHTRSEPYIDAHDFVVDRFDLRQVRTAWANSQLVRDRQVLVARRGGRPIAAAVLELAEDGLHLFGLYDTVRLFALGAPGEQGFTELLEGAREWYRQRGKEKYMYFMEGGDASHAAQAGLIDLGEATLVILAAELMADQIEHAWEITVPKEDPPGPRAI
jgi:hypothetical protein